MFTLTKYKEYIYIYIYIYICNIYIYWIFVKIIRSDIRFKFLKRYLKNKIYTSNNLKTENYLGMLTNFEYVRNN